MNRGRKMKRSTTITCFQASVGEGTVEFFANPCYDYAIELSVKMLVFEAKLEGTNEQYRKLDEAIRTARFVRNSCVRYWMDNKGIGKYELSAYCAVLAANPDFPYATKLNSMARQASAVGEAFPKGKSVVCYCSVP
jgi:hypothetical protein